MLKDDSPLHRLPPGYPVPLVQMLDGIRYAIAMADLSYGRVRQTLATAFQEPEARPNPFRLATAAFLDAWSMIDSMHRLGKLLWKTATWNAIPEVEVFLEAVRSVADLRNSFQHADERVRDAAPFPMPGVPPLWGTIECLGPGADRTKARSLSITPGNRTFRWARSEIVGRPYPSPPVDHIALTAFGVAVSLTELHGALAPLVPALERYIPPVPNGATFSDLMITAGVAYDDTDGGTTP
jgi:hypothetical protein